MRGAWCTQECRQRARDVVLFGQLTLFGVGSVQEEGDSGVRAKGLVMASVLQLSPGQRIWPAEPSGG